MNKEQMLVILKKSALCLVGVAVYAFGAVFLLRSGLGLDPIAVWADGIAKTFRISFGDAIWVISILLILLAILLARKNIGIGTVFFVALGGPAINLAEFLLRDALPGNGSYTLISQIILFGCAVLLICLGLAVVVACRFGFNAGDAVLFVIADKTRIQFRWLRVANDWFYVIIGFFMGGSVGIGTLVGAFLYGPLITEAVKFYNKTILKWLGLQDIRNEFRRTESTAKETGEPVK